MKPVETEQPKHLQRNPDYPNLLRGGVPGNAGGPGRTPDLIRGSSREDFDDFRANVAPVMSRMGQYISDLDSDDGSKVEAAQQHLRRYRDAGFSVDAVLKAWAKLGDVGLPKQSEITLSNQDVLNVVAEVAGSYYGPDNASGSVEGFVTACVSALGLPK